AHILCCTHLSIVHPIAVFSLSLTTRPPPRSTLFPYTTLFRSHDFLRYGRLKDTFEAIDVNVSDEHIYHIADYFIENLTNYSHVFQDAYETLDQLKSKYRLHIITNGPEKVQEKKLKNSKLEHYFETVTNSEKAGVKKPHPGIFQYALSQANADPQNSLMIGDNIKADIHGALNVGMDVIWFNEFQLENADNITEIH